MVDLYGLHGKLKDIICFYLQYGWNVIRIYGCCIPIHKPRPSAGVHWRKREDQGPWCLALAKPHFWKLGYYYSHSLVPFSCRTPGDSGWQPFTYNDWNTQLSRNFRKMKFYFRELEKKNFRQGFPHNMHGFRNSNSLRGPLDRSPYTQKKHIYIYIHDRVTLQRRGVDRHPPRTIWNRGTLQCRGVDHHPQGQPERRKVYIFKNKTIL